MNSMQWAPTQPQGLKLTSQSMNMCGNCGCAAYSPVKCGSCSSIVCSTCMTSVDSCCLACQDVFPVAQPMLYARQQYSLDQNQCHQAYHAPRQVNRIPSDIQATFERIPVDMRRTLDGGLPFRNLANHCPPTTYSSRRSDFLVCTSPMSNWGNGKTTVSIDSLLGTKTLADAIDSFDKERGIINATKAAALQMTSNVTGSDTTRSSECVKQEACSTEEDEDIARTPIVSKRLRRKVTTDANGTTTMMVCNIPCRVSTECMITAIDAVGFHGTYEFLHLPCRYGQESSSNLGYGFVNFLSADVAAKFAVAFEGYHFKGSRSVKKCTVKTASFQGFNANAKRPSRKK